jgi:ribonuclease HIII
MHGSKSYKINLNQEPSLSHELERAGLRFSDFDYAFWRATNDTHTLTLYRSGKLLIQGKDVEWITRLLLNKGFALSDPNPPSPQRPGVSKWIGTDESGKGDYFGPLIIAGVLVTTETRRELLRNGAKDSKRLPDSSIKKLAPKIKDLCPHSIIVISPTQYNKAYETLQDAKHYRILAWGHAQAIENILEDEDCHYALVDQFGHERFIKNALMEKGKHIRLEQRPHAEDDIAVASASILARDEYLTRLSALSIEYSIHLSPGASHKIIEIGQEFVLRHGADKLKEVAKTHFITTQHILNPSSIASNF